MSWHYLRGREEASWEESCLDGAPSALLKLMPTPGASCSPDNAGQPAQPEPRDGGALADSHGGMRDGRTDEQGREQEERAAAGGSGKDVSDAECGRLAMLRCAQGNAGHADGVHEAVADAEGERGGAGLGEAGQERDGREFTDGGGTGEMGHACGVGRDAGRRDDGEHDGTEPDAAGEHGEENWWATEPDVGRVAHGVASRVDRLRCIGNGQVPQAMRLAWDILAAGGW